MKFKDAGDEKSTHANILIYARSGVGKTRWSATAVDPILMLDFERGSLSVKRKIKIHPCRNMEDFREAFEFLSKDKHDFKTLVVDSLSEIVDAQMEEIKRTTPKSHGGQHDARIIYPLLYDKITSILRHIRKLPMHLIFTCKEEDTLQNEITIARPRVQGSRLISELPYLFDTVIRLTVDDKRQRFASASPSELWEAKDRSDMLPKEAMLVDDYPLSRVISMMISADEQKKEKK